MAHIEILPPEVANQIAAGEVIERPASVVKELVENSLDARARRISITLQLGGKRLIRVDDDGEGMEPNDVKLCFERHATSKIRRADDLEAIATLGFRGEALPSIASVSHMTLRSRRTGAQTATQAKMQGGTVSSLTEIGAPEGTSVEVCDLFYNLPARRKFLKSDSAEAAQVSRLVAQLAMGYPEVGFALTSAGRRALQCTPASGFQDRLFQLHGDRRDLVEVYKEAAGLKVFGYVAALTDAGPTRGSQQLFVNRRIVKDRTIMHAIIEAYSLASIKERSPEVCLFLELDPERVDVNVHPTKAEVRFLEQSLVHEIVRRAVADALGQGLTPELQFRTISVGSLEAVPTLIPGVFDGVSPVGRWHAEAGRGAEVPGEPAPVGSSQAAIAPPLGAVPALSLPRIRPLVALGQFRDTFIIAVDEEGIAIVDQHVAHERVLFEHLLQHLEAGPLASQRLLDPILVTLPDAGRQALLSHGSDLERFGFEIEDFGRDTVRISATPALLRREDCRAAIVALANDLDNLERGTPIAVALRRMSATMACHAAVKANHPLTLEKMTYILEELRRTAYSTVCPHGRPVMLRMTRREVERNFERT